VSLYIVAIFTSKSNYDTVELKVQLKTIFGPTHFGVPQAPSSGTILKNYASELCFT
jgi:hypothetical protein